MYFVVFMSYLLFGAAIIALIKKQNEAKKKLNKLNEKYAYRTQESVQKEISALKKEEEDMSKKLQMLKKEEIKLHDNIKMYQEENEMQICGLYNPTYSLMSVDSLKEKLSRIRDRQKQMVKDDIALNFSTFWTLDGDTKAGEKLNRDNMKMVLRAFNNECTASVQKVRYSNIATIEKKIRKAAEQINKLNERNKISITDEYLQLKIDELYVAYDYECAKQKERERIAALKEQEKEERRVQKELEEQRKKSEKDIKHYENARREYETQIEKFKKENRDTADLESMVQEIEQKISDKKKDVEKMDYRQANQKAGYVYIISNIGSFGKDVYKIGMTRRLNPADRINELSSASVPFKFDVHAMIFSDDAPKLEADLHRAFEKKRVNLVNNRKEFFHVTLDDIKKELKKHHEELIEISDYPEAEEYYQTLEIQKKNNS